MRCEKRTVACRPQGKQTAPNNNKQSTTCHTNPIHHSPSSNMAQASIAFLRSSNRGGSLTRLFGRRNATFFNANRPSLGCTDNDHGLFRHHLQHQHHEHRRSMGHSVRLIALEDLPHGKAYRGDVVRVKAGYARNHLIPQKLALYATPQNFEKLGLVDPDVETEEQRRERLAREASATVQEEAYLKAADILKKYLRNKVLKIWRNVDPNTVDVLHPGSVTALNVRQKLSKQLRIDLEDDESIHFYSEAPIAFSELTDSKIQKMVDEFQPTQTADDGSSQIRIKKLGEYLVKISLGGGFSVPLRVSVRQRMP